MLLRGSSSELLVVFLVASCWRTGGGPLTPRARSTDWWPLGSVWPCMGILLLLLTDLQVYYADIQNVRSPQQADYISKRVTSIVALLVHTRWQEDEALKVQGRNRSRDASSPTNWLHLVFQGWPLIMNSVDQESQSSTIRVTGLVWGAAR
jgi:hypothetical protein